MPETSSQPAVHRLVEVQPSAPSPAQLWGIVLAGGEGVRLRPLARRVCGDERPKQYVPLFGDCTLLRETLNRVALGISPTRTAVVTLRSHARSRGVSAPARDVVRSRQPATSL